MRFASNIVNRMCTRLGISTALPRLMQANFETIASDNLDHVHGGQDTTTTTPPPPTNSSAENISGNIGITVKDTQIGIQGDYNKSNYSKCLEALTSLPNVKPEDFKMCGLPPA